MPSVPIAKVASRSGRQGEHIILHVRVSPRPFFSHNLVVEACAMMLPPMGFTLGPANMLPPSKFAATTCISKGASVSHTAICTANIAQAKSSTVDCWPPMHGIAFLGLAQHGCQSAKPTLKEMHQPQPCFNIHRWLRWRYASSCPHLFGALLASCVHAQDVVTQPGPDKAGEIVNMRWG